MKNFSRLISIIFLLVCWTKAEAQTKVNGIAYKPVQGKSTGIWPQNGRWTVADYKDYKNEWGFEKLLVAAYTNKEPAFSLYYNMAVIAGYTPENLLVVVKDTLYESIADKLPAAYYYLDEPVEHNCTGNPSNSWVSHIYSPTELRSIRDYIQTKQPGAEFVIGGYKRCSHFKKAAEIADRVMYSSYETWNEFGFLPICPVNLGWADDIEKPWQTGSDDQSSSWQDMRNKFGSQFNMTWIDGRGDQYDALFQKANSLGLETIWFYGGSGVDDASLISFCETAVEYGWLEKVDSTAIDAPTNLTADEASEHSVQLNWTDNSSVESGFSVMRRTGSSGTFSVIADLTANTTQFIDTTTTQSTEYTYRIQAYNNYAVSGFTNDVTIALAVDPIVAPSNLSSELDNTNNVVLSWNDNSENEDGFIIEKSISDSVSFNILENVAANTTSFTDTETGQNTRYHYRVKAYNNFTESGYSSISTIYRPADAIPDPSELTIELNESNYVSLTWADNSQNESGFYIEKSIGNDSSYNLIDSVAQNTAAYLDTNTEQNSKYFYRIRAYNQLTVSGYTNSVRIQIPIDSISAPSGLTSILNDAGDVLLTWSDNSNNEDGFQLERKQDTENNFSVLQSLESNSRNFIDNSTTAGKTYEYRVKAYNSLTVSSYSNITTISIPNESISAPTDLDGTFNDSKQAVLSWTDNSNNETGFVLYKKFSTDSIYTGNIKLSANSTGYTDENVVAGYTYNYRIKAYNQNGQSEYSNEIAVLIPPDEINKPNVLQLSFDRNTGIIFVWLDNSDNESGFIIERMLSGESSFALVDSVAQDVTSYVDSNYNDGSIYFYRVIAFNQFIQSEYSDTFSVTIPHTPVASPAELQAELDEFRNVLLTWTDNSDNENGFMIERKVSTDLSFQVIDSTGENSTSFSDEQVAGGTEYDYRVKAFNDYLNSDYTDTVSISVPHNPIFPPTDLHAAVNELRNVILSWQDNSDNENGFVIERKHIGDESFAVLDSTEFNVETYSDTSVTEGNEYEYRMKAFNEFLISAYSDTVLVLIPHRPINPPSALHAERDNPGRVRLNWQDNSDNENEFIIDRKTAGDSAFISIDTVSQDVTVYADSMIYSGTMYSYRVAAHNSFVQSVYSDTATITIPFEPINSPTELSGQLRDNRRVFISWQDNSANELGFAIERKTALETTFTIIDSTLADSSSYVDTTLFEDGSYIYRIFAFNDDTASIVSNEVSIDVVMTDIPDEVPGTYSNRIYQNYPNPFNPSTTIKFSIADNRNVIIKLYNTIGKEIRTIYQGSMRAGIHEVEFNSGRLPSGVYYFRLITGDYTETKKLILLK